MAAQSATPLLKVEGLKQYFKVNKNFTVKAVDDVSLDRKSTRLNSSH